MKIKLNGKIFYPTDLVKYLGVKIDSKLNWKIHVNDITTKLINLLCIILNHTSTMLALYRDKILSQLTVSTFSRK